MKVLDEFHTSLTSPRNVEIHAVQGDGARTVVAILYAGEELWSVPEGATGRISYTLPDGSSGCYEMMRDGTPACIISGHRVEAVIAAGLCLIPGAVKAVIVLEKDGIQISTFPFTLRVEARPGYPESVGEADAVPAFAGKLFYGGSNGAPVPLEVGAGLAVTDGALQAKEETGDSLKGYVDTRIDALRADLQYEPITVTAVSIAPSVAQLGAVIDRAILVWGVSRAPAAQQVDGQTVDPGLRRIELERTFGQTQSVQIAVTDERGGRDEKSATILFCNAVYWTSHWSDQGLPSDEQLLQMQQKLQIGREMTVAADSGEGEHILCAFPSRYGTPEFWANGFQGGFRLAGTVAHTNGFGYQEDYSVWISESGGLNLTVTVR